MENPISILSNWLAEIAARELDIAIVPEIFEPECENFGDFSTNICFKLAKSAHKAPRQCGEIFMKQELPPQFSHIEMAGAGFLNFHFSADFLARTIDEILLTGWTSNSKNEYLENTRIQLEFVSANPTGPLNIVSARAAAVGSVLANVLEFEGHTVEREFYINDAGNQVRLLAQSLLARAHSTDDAKIDIPEGGYHGEYLVEYAKKYLALDKKPADIETWITDQIISDQKTVLANFGTRFDVWFSEKNFRNSGEVEKTLERLTNSGFTYEKEGALWFAASRIDNNCEDFVLVKRDGLWAYGLVDIAYHVNKFEHRAFDRVYTILGPDHHGHKARLDAALTALGLPSRLEVLILQQVNLLDDGIVVKMSKRSGKLIEMRELIEEVGKNSARFFFLNRKMEAHLDFDLNVARRTDEENPVYYIQYAHARIISILEFARNKDFDISHNVKFDLLTESEEKLLARKICKFTQATSIAARQMQPHILPAYLIDLARCFHGFYAKHKVVDAEYPMLSQARIQLVAAVAATLRTGLNLCEIDAPDKM